MTSSIATDAEDGAITADAKYIAGSPGAARATASETGAESGDIATTEVGQLAAFAVAHQVHTRLSDVAPVRAPGFDHTTQGAFAAAASAAKALGLPAEQIANAVAMAGTANVALRVTRTGNLSHWKGLAYPHVAKEGTWSALLASRGITGPEEVVEGNKGFKALAGDYTLDWASEDLESVTRTIIKKYNAEIHSQSALDAALDIRKQDGFNPAHITSIELATFDVAYSIIGGGEEGDKQTIRTKEEADHSLPWMLAIALLDGELNPAQYEPGRIIADDVQQLMRTVTITPDDPFSDRFPQEMPACLTITLDDGTVFIAEESAYDGFFTPATGLGRCPRQVRHAHHPVRRPGPTRRDQRHRPRPGEPPHQRSDCGTGTREHHPRVAALQAPLLRHDRDSRSLLRHLRHPSPAGRLRRRRQLSRRRQVGRWLLLPGAAGAGPRLQRHRPRK